MRHATLTSTLICIAVLALGLVAPTDTRARVLGEDERRSPGAGDAQLVRAIGLVFCSGEFDGRRRVGAGTGTIVGSRSTILTAAHVFTDPEGRQGPRVDFDPVSDCTFRQYDEHGDLLLETGFAQASMGAYRQSGRDPNQDWAVLRTAVPMPATSEPLPFATVLTGSAELAGLRIRMLAFHRDASARSRLPLLSEGSLLDVDYGGYPRLAHTADMERMSSGAAIVHLTGDGTHVVVGINRSAATLADFNLAVPLSRELLQVLASYAHGHVPQRRQLLAGARD